MSTDNWNTPRWLAQALVAGYGRIALDPCSNATSPLLAVIECDGGANGDGLALDWAAAAHPRPTNKPPGLVYVNPPYSAPGKWLAKCEETAKVGIPVAALLRLDTTTSWWRRYCEPAYGAFMFRERLAYGREGLENKKANFPSALVCWHHPPTALYRALEGRALFWRHQCSLS